MKAVVKVTESYTREDKEMRPGFCRAGISWNENIAAPKYGTTVTLTWDEECKPKQCKTCACWRTRTRSDIYPEIALCMLPESEHYGVMLAEWHPACDHYIPNLEALGYYDKIGVEIDRTARAELRGTSGS